jgi:hypothetical protein
VVIYPKKFSCTESVLRREPQSLLASLCDSECTHPRDEDGCYVFADRDWWLFRHLLCFLRDGALPDDRSLLAQLYREAAYWRLRQLQRAIEELKVHTCRHL